MRTLDLLAAFIGLAITVPALTQTALTSQVIFQNGSPAAHAEVSRYWVLGTTDEGGARAYAGVKTDLTGRFSLPLEEKDLPADLLVYPADRDAAAVVHVDSLTAPADIVVAPVSPVRIVAEASSLGEHLNGTRFLLQSVAGVTLAQLFGNKVKFPCPAGTYQLSLSSADTISVNKQVNVGSEKPRSLHFALELSPMAKHYGKIPPPLTGLVDADGRVFQTPPFDRPTLLYFWADWCQPCIAEGIPRLLQFAEAHKGERFQIIAVHENGIPSPSTTAAFRRSLQHLQQSVWKCPASIPFVFDASGKVTSSWGLSTFPTYALIGSQGTLARESGIEALEEAMKK